MNYPNKSDYPFIAMLEENCPIIREEFDGFRKNNIHRFITWKAKDIGVEDKWKIFGFNWINRKFPKNMEFFPKTIEIIDRIPNVSLSTFSWLRPHTSIPPHRGYESNVLRCSLGVVVPDKCYLSVDGETRQMKEGKAILFDDTYNHYAWNDSDEDRFVLLLDFLKPSHKFIEPLTPRCLDVLYKMHERDWRKCDIPADSSV